MIKASLAQFPAVALVGPRQSGKTTLAQSLKGVYFDLEQEADIASFLHCYKPKEDKSNIYWLIRKNRNGPLANIHFRFVGNDVAFYDWDDNNNDG